MGNTNLYVDEEGQSVFPIGMMQNRLLDFELRNRGSMNFGYAIRIQGDLTPAFVLQNIQRMVDDNDALRIVLTDAQEEKYYFSILENYRFELEQIDCVGADMEEKICFAREEIKRRFEEPMDLWSIMVKAYLYKIKEEDYLLVMKYHHLVTDGVAMLLTIGRLDNYMFQPGYSHPEKVRTYIEYIKEEQHALVSPDYEASRQYWRDKIEGFEIYNLPTVQETAYESSRSLGTVKIEKQQFLRYIKKHRVSIFLVLMLAYHISLMKMFNRTDTALTYVISNRNKRKYSEMIGLMALFCNSRHIVKYSDLASDLLFDIMADVRLSTKHATVSLTQPTIDFVLSYQPVAGDISDIGDYKLDMFMTTSMTDHDLSMFLVNINETTESLELALACDIHKFSKSLCICFLETMKHAIRVILENDDITIEEVIKKIPTRIPDEVIANEKF